MADKVKRSRGYYIQLNYEYEYNATGISEEDWREKVTTEWLDLYDSGTADYVVFIFHDKDIKDGKPVGLHAHMVIRFKNPRYQTAVMELLNTSSLQNTQPIRRYSGATQYLLHANSQSVQSTKKHIYGQDELIYRGIEPRELMQGTGSKKVNRDDLKDRVAELGKQIRMGELTIVDVENIIVDEFGERYWRAERADFKVDEEEYLAILGRRAVLEGFDRQTFYVSGPSSIGKSTTMTKVAARLADSRGIHPISSGGRDLTFDFAGTYNGEKVTLADDMDSSAFHERDFFNMFDPHIYSPTKSRNKDKHWLSKYVFITNTDHLPYWIFKLIYYSSRRYQSMHSEYSLSYNALPSIYQSARRFKYWFQFRKEKITIYKPINADDLIDKGNEIGAWEIDKYFEKVAVIEFENLFEKQDEIADKILRFIQGEINIEGVEFVECPTKTEK